jgi:hypothetical protein
MKDMKKSLLILNSRGSQPRRDERRPAQSGRAAAGRPVD